MARVPNKHGRDQPMDFRGFLNDLQDWELSIKDKDKKMRTRGSENSGGVAGGRSITFDYYNARGGVSSSFMAEEGVHDAASEKELGNEYFKQKKFKEAVECYSRSIAFSPTAVAYANRAMAYIKLRRFQEAEEDCTEALNLDDRYIKAYSRRATARKELGKLKESIEDADFALRLEPQNQELKKQYTEAKSLYDKEMLKKVAGAVRKSATGELNREYPENKATSHKPVVATIKEDCQENFNGQIMPKKPASVEEVHGGVIKGGSKHDGHEVAGTNGNDSSKSYRDSKRNHRAKKQELNPSVLESASRAASRAAAEAAKNLTPPTSAYQFEVSWRGLSADPALQARLLKVTSPSALPQIFKNALSAPILIDIVKCVSTFFNEDMDLVVRYLENLTKVPRFDILILCLSSTEKTELLKIWDEVFCNKATPIEYAEVLDQLRSKYCLK